MTTNDGVCGGVIYGPISEALAEALITEHRVGSDKWRAGKPDGPRS